MLFADNELKRQGTAKPKGERGGPQCNASDHFYAVAATTRARRTIRRTYLTWTTSGASFKGICTEVTLLNVEIGDVPCVASYTPPDIARGNVTVTGTVGTEICTLLVASQIERWFSTIIS